MELFLLLVLAHVVADFPLQTAKIAAEKCAGKASGYIRHAAVHCALLILFTHPFLSPFLVLLWFALPLVHIGLDLLKNKLVRPNHQADAPSFLADQVLHLFVLFFAWQLITVEPNPTVILFYNSLLSESGCLLWSFLFPNPDWAVILLIATVYVYVLLGGAVFIRKVLRLDSLKLPGGAGRYGDARQAGRCIGILERAIILTLTISGAYTSIAFVLTAKSIARYKELEDRDFAEYYIVGTLLSALIAIAGGLFLRRYL